MPKFLQNERVMKRFSRSQLNARKKKQGWTKSNVIEFYKYKRENPGVSSAQAARVLSTKWNKKLPPRTAQNWNKLSLKERQKLLANLESGIVKQDQMRIRKRISKYPNLDKLLFMAVKERIRLKLTRSKEWVKRTALEIAAKEGM